MAKMFYTLDETKAALGRNEEGIKQLAREGRLREFRDGPRLMFKADQVEALKADIAGGGEISLSAQESTGGLSLAGESKSGSTAGIPMADTKGGVEVPQGGSVGGVPSPGKLTPANTGSGAGTGSGSGMLNLGGSGAGSGSGMLNLGGSGAAAGSGLSAHGTRGGITIFDVDESNRVDPSAQTAINTAQNEQLNLEGVGSGSGLLDLTRESDDTSLGAVFDELAPNKSAGGPAPRVAPSSLETQQGSGVGPAIVDTGRRVSAPIYVEASDPLGAALGIASIVPIVCLGFACFVLGALLLGYRPEILNDLGDWQNGKVKTYIFAAAGLTLLFGAIGYFVSSAMKK
ncbi:MAG: hypothetical protein ABSH20_04835 [Tepidisphaeraceae bacterium]